MCHQLAGAGNATRLTQTRMINQTVGFLRKKLIESQCSAWVIGLYVVIDRTAVIYGFMRPE